MSWIWSAIVNAAIWIGGKLMAMGVSQNIAVAIGYVIVGTAAIGGAKWLGGRLIDVPDIGLGQQGATILANAPSNTAPIPVIYGARRVGGTRVFIGTSNAYDDDGNFLSANSFLNMVFSICEGRISEFTAVYLNNVEAWPNKDPRFGDQDVASDKTWVYIEPHLGLEDQPVSANLKYVAGFGGGTWSWTDAYRLRGVAYCYVRLQYNTEIWASGVPTVSFDIKGKHVQDPRQTATSTGLPIERFSNNPALCIRDYLISSNYGRAIDSALIDDTTFESAADYCDEVVTFTQTVSGTTTSVAQKRYTLNGVVNTAETSINILDKMLTTCRGSLIFSGGKYKLILDKPTTPALTFDESNIMPDYEIILGGKENLANKITAEFFNPDREWQADFSIVESSTYKEHDNDLLLHKKIELPFTANLLMAKYIANQNLKISRQNVIISFKTTQD